MLESRESRNTRRTRPIQRVPCRICSLNGVPGSTSRIADARVSRSRMGCADPRRSQTFRIPHSRSRAGGTQLVDRAQETRGLPPRVQPVRSGEGGAILRGANRQADRRSGDHPEPDEDRGRREERAGVSGRAERIRKLRRVLLAVRRMAGHGRIAGALCARFPRRPPSPTHSAAISSAADSASSDRP